MTGGRTGGSVRRSINRVLGANGVALLISTLMILVVPKLVGVAVYGYWQLFVFCLTWAGVLHLGWVDGVFLKILGHVYDDLDHAALGRQFWALVAWISILAAVVAACGVLMPLGASDRFFVLLLAPALALVATNAFMIFVLQATNRLTEYSKITVAERFAFAVIVASGLGLRMDATATLLIAELAARMISFTYLSLCVREIVWAKPSPGGWAREARHNVGVGSRLLVSNLASLGVVGVARIAIQGQWGVEVFGKISLVLGIVNMALVLISSLSVVALPLLKRAPRERLPSIFASLQGLASYGMLVGLLAVLPLELIFIRWLPTYAEGLRYLTVLFPLCYFNAKMSVLVESFWKVMRKENLMSLVNLTAVALSLLWSGISVYGFRSLDGAVMGMTATVAMRSLIGEMMVERDLGIQRGVRAVGWLALVSLFMVLGLGGSTWQGGAIYLAALAVVLVADRRFVLRSFREVFVRVQQQ